MQIQKLTLTLVALAIFGIFACVKDEKENPKTLLYAYDYFPLKTGKYRVYQIDSLLYDYAQNKITVDSVRTYIKEIVIDSFQGASGNIVYRIERYEKKDSSINWNFKDVVSEERSNTQAIRSETNFRLLKLIFPLSENDVWSPTVFIDNNVEVKIGKKEIKPFTNWSADIENLSTDVKVSNQLYKDVLIINQADDENALELRKVQECYAKGIGLISNETQILDTQDITSKESWRKKAQKGYILKQYLIDYN